MRAAKPWRGLRFRLAVSYALFFSVLLLGIGLVFRERLAAILDEQMRETLEEEWGAAKGYLRIENHQPVWWSDPNDPEEAFVVERLRHVFLLADESGKPRQWSETYERLGLDDPQTIRAILARAGPVYTTRRDARGVAYLIRAGRLPDDAGHHYFLAIGRSLAHNEEVLKAYSRTYFFLIPATIAVASLLGWFLAARALRPLESVARAAAGLSPGNLHADIPLRGAGDELDRLIATFNEMAARLDKSFNQIRQFSADVSHELRTPLTAIRGQLEVALLTARTPEQFREALEHALGDVERLAAIVKALFQLAQAEAGQTPLNIASTDLGELARHIVSEFEIVAAGAGVALRHDIAGDCTLAVDRVQMERLLSNLLSNAIKYTPRGGRVDLRLVPEGDWLRLTVSDTGVGIPADRLPYIFDRYYRVKGRATQQEQGLGLGLSFVAWIVRTHGGRMEVDSEVGKGSTFTVLLPRSPDAARPEEAGGATLKRTWVST